MLFSSSRGGVPVFSRAKSKADGLQGAGELHGSFLSRTAGTEFLLSQMAEPVQEGAGGQNDAGCVDPIPGSRFDAGDLVSPP